MSFEEQAAVLTKEEIVSLLSAQRHLAQENEELRTTNVELTHQIEWFRRQLFGQKSERRAAGSEFSKQLSLGEALKSDSTPPPPDETIKSYQRKKRNKIPLEGSPDDTGLRFDPELVPVQEIPVPNPEIEGLSEDEYEVIGERCTYRLAQRPGAYVVLKYVRQCVKLRGAEQPTAPAAPPAVLEKSYPDVSLLALLLIDKFVYHLPLYRQHQRLKAAGIELSRSSLTNWVHLTADLLQPIYYALFSSVLQSEVLAMDETPIKAGRKVKGKLQQAYFWPVYGDKDEIVFPFSASRATKVVREALGDWCGVLISDGYRVYDRFAKEVNEVTHAQCWAHMRRKFVEAERDEPALSAEALARIRNIYQQESAAKPLSPERLAEQRALHTKPLVDEFFLWLDSCFKRQVLLPSSPFSNAANYALQREAGLRVFLQFPNVPLDTNHLERALRPIPMGRKNWLFCWSEVGARYVGIVQSILQSCRLAGVDPYTYLVDVLQRIETHPAIDVHLLTPRLWKENFAEDPLRSDLSTLQ